MCGRAPLNPDAYAYLLGLYLGDGHIVAMKRGVFHLRIFLDQRYPGVIRECMEAMAHVRGAGRRAGVLHRQGCDMVNLYWKHWPCVFPQHGRGMKHQRKIRLLSWQEGIVRAEPGQFLRGLIHSDGSRDLNPIRGREYPRYQFTNASEDILRIFGDACDEFGIRWRRSNWRTISIARRADVAKLDKVIGPKL